MRMSLGADGPDFSINKKDVWILRKIGFIDFKDNGISVRISLTEKDPNSFKLTSGVIIKRDPFAELGHRVRRYPENCCPFDTRPLYYILRISKKKFEEFLSSNERYTNGCFDEHRHLDSRCKYDRFSLHYYNH